MKRSVDANRLLAALPQLDPSRASMSFQFPSRTTVPISRCRRRSQTWIANHGKECAAGKLQHNAWTGPIFLLIVGEHGGARRAQRRLQLATRLWDRRDAGEDVPPARRRAAVAGARHRRVRRVAKSPYGKYTTIHPLHLMQVDVDKVTMWPLVNLHDVSLTHHSTNGVYQYTAVRMDFAGTFCNLTIRGQQASVDWANRAAGAAAPRARAHVDGPARRRRGLRPGSARAARSAEEDARRQERAR